VEREADGRYARQPIAHGTSSGFRQHQRHGEPDTPACGCRDAYNAWDRARRRAWRASRGLPERAPRARPALDRATVLQDEILAGMSARELAGRLGVTTRTIVRWRAMLRKEAG
jgi:hypothetical protein